MTTPDPKKYCLKIDDVCRLIDPNSPIHRSTLWRWIRAGDVPEPTLIGKSKRWSYEDFGVEAPGVGVQA